MNKNYKKVPKSNEVSECYFVIVVKIEIFWLLYNVSRHHESGNHVGQIKSI